VSYSHAADGQLAPALQAGLQSLAKPWYRRRALRVFRDKTSLSASPELWPAIEQALAQARYFVLLASPVAAASGWVEQEVRWWRAHRSRDTVLIVLTDGQLVWDNSIGDFDSHKTNAIPPGLRGWFTVEPLWVDLRWARDQRHVSPRNPGFRDALADLAAPLRGLPKDELVGEDIRQHRRVRRLARGAVTLLTLLAVLAAGAAVVAVRNQRAAQEQLRVATSRQLAANAELQASSDPQLAALLSAAAFKAKDTPEARTSLVRRLTRQLVRRPRIVRFLSGHAGPVGSVAFSPDGRTLAAAGGTSVAARGSSVGLWEVGTGRRLATLPGVASPVTFSPRGGALATAGEKDIVVWDVAQHSKLASFPAGNGGNGGGAGPIAVSPDGRTLAIGGVDSTKIILWDLVRRVQVSTLAIQPPGQTAPAATGNFALAFSPDGQTLAANGPDGSDILLWDTSSGVPVADLRGGHDRGVFSLTFSPDGRTLASGGHDAKVILWDVAKRAKLAGLQADGDVWSVAFNPDGRTLASADGGRHIALWDVTRHTRSATLTGHTSTVVSVAFSPDGRTLASAGDDTNVALWDLTGQHPLVSASLASASSPFAFSPDGRLLASGDGKNVLVWDHARHTRLANLPGAGSPVGFTDNGAALVAAGRKSVAVWDVARARQRARLATVPVGAVVALSPDGRTLATAGRGDKEIVLWDVAQRTRLATLPQATGAFSLAFSTDGRTLASGGLNEIVLWDAASPSHRQLATLPGHNPAGGVATIAFSPDGQFLASAAMDNAQTALGCAGCNLVLWDLTRHAEVATLLGRLSRFP
jgi:WD40 repeat protein